MPDSMPPDAHCNSLTPSMVVTPLFWKGKSLPVMP